MIRLSTCPLRPRRASVKSQRLTLLSSSETTSPQRSPSKRPKESRPDTLTSSTAECKYSCYVCCCRYCVCVCSEELKAQGQSRPDFRAIAAEWKQMGREEKNEWASQAPSGSGSGSQSSFQSSGSSFQSSSSSGQSSGTSKYGSPAYQAFFNSRV